MVCFFEIFDIVSVGFNCFLLIISRFEFLFGKQHCGNCEILTVRTHNI